MSIYSPTDDFFTAGGTLPPDAPSYVKRPADDELFRHLMAGEFCYVLTPRQMGKSSLMVRTAQRLREQNIKTAIVDLTQIGTVENPEEWYKGILTQIIRRLSLAIDLGKWWGEKGDVPAVQKFIGFFGDVLSETTEQIIIFVDEIDSTLNVSFRDDFFAGIRSIYNTRAEQSEYKRVSFVLLGVASPADLISDTARTPFNVGVSILLQDFSIEDTDVLQKGLDRIFSGKGKDILKRIFFWTNGHPYLTQKICREVVEKNEINWGEDEIDALINKLFLSEQTRKDENLRFVNNQVLSVPQYKELLSLYRHVLLNRAVFDERQSVHHNQLKLSGLVKVTKGQLIISNEIYRRVFNENWIKENLRQNTQGRAKTSKKPQSNRLQDFMDSLHPFLLTIVFSPWLIILFLFVSTYASKLSQNDLSFLYSFIGWFSVFYSLFIVIVLVNVWNQFSILESDFDRELSVIASLHQTVMHVREIDKQHQPKVIEFKEMLRKGIKDYAKHVTDNYQIEGIRPLLLHNGDRILEDIGARISSLATSQAVVESMIYELFSFLREATATRGDRISHSKQHIPTPVWSATIISSIIWLIPFLGLSIQDPWVSMILIGGISFVTLMMLIIIRDLDTPFDGVWKIEPNNWIEFLESIEESVPSVMFVYNKKDTLFDRWLKSCKLWSLTHTMFFERREWRELFEHIQGYISCEILYSDKYIIDFGELDLPAVIYRRGDEFDVLISDQEINGYDDFAKFESVLKKRLLQQSVLDV